MTDQLEVDATRIWASAATNADLRGVRGRKLAQSLNEDGGAQRWLGAFASERQDLGQLVVDPAVVTLGSALAASAEGAAMSQALQTPTRGSLAPLIVPALNDPGTPIEAIINAVLDLDEMWRLAHPPTAELASAIAAELLRPEHGTEQVIVGAGLTRIANRLAARTDFVWGQKDPTLKLFASYRELEKASGNRLRTADNLASRLRAAVGPDHPGTPLDVLANAAIIPARYLYRIALPALVVAAATATAPPGRLGQRRTDTAREGPVVLYGTDWDQAETFAFELLSGDLFVHDDRLGRRLVTTSAPSDWTDAQREQHMAEKLCWLVSEDHEIPTPGWHHYQIEANGMDFDVELAVASIDGPVSLRFEDRSTLSWHLPTTDQGSAPPGQSERFERPPDVSVDPAVAEHLGSDTRTFAFAINRYLTTREMEVRSGPRPGLFTVTLRSAADARFATEGQQEALVVQHASSANYWQVSNEASVDLQAAAIAAYIDDTLRQDTERTNKTVGGADSLTPISQSITIDLVEQLSEEDAAGLWRELEPLRRDIGNLLQTDLLTDDVVERTRNQLHRLEAELGETGGALGGVVRSYYLELLGVLANTRRPQDASAASVHLEQLRAGIDAMAADPRQPDALGPVLDTIEAALAEANPEIQPEIVREALEVKLGLRDRISDRIAETNSGLIENRGLIGLGTTLGAGTGVGLVSAGASEAIAAGAGVLVTVVVTILAMANRAYRISRKLQ